MCCGHEYIFTHIIRYHIYVLALFCRPQVQVPLLFFLAFPCGVGVAGDRGGGGGDVVVLTTTITSHRKRFMYVMYVRTLMSTFHTLLDMYVLYTSYTSYLSAVEATPKERSRKSWSPYDTHKR